MIDPKLLPAIQAAVKTNEIGTASPYRLSYARRGSSGASFGVCQGDTNTNLTARSVLRRVLMLVGVDTDTVSRVLWAVSKPCPQGCPLSAADATVVDNALASPGGRGLVDAMDARLMATVVSGVESCLAVAGRRGLTIAPEALLYIALWVNMSGVPTTLCGWLAGTPEIGLAPPTGPAVTRDDLKTYLTATAYFTAHPGAMAHIDEAVASARPLLPVAQG